MAQYEFSTSAQIHAPAERLYAIIADYQNGHPRILPKPHFVSLQVEQGGVGRGTLISFQMKLMGRLQDYRARIDEPEPGRVLTETNEGSGVITRFIVDPRDDGRSAFVTISTTLPVRSGLAGKLEGWLASRLLRPIYTKELQQLAEVAAEI